MQLVLKVALSLVLIFILSLFLLEKDNEVVEEEAFKVELTAKVLKNDIFQLFYSLENQDGFDEHHSVSLEVLGKDDFQTITFSIPDTLKITKLRIDVGHNKEQQAIELTNIKIRNKNNVVSFENEEIFRTFHPNGYAFLNSDSTRVSLKEVDGAYDPFISSSELFNEYKEVLYSDLSQGSTVKELSSYLAVVSLAIVLLLAGAHFKNALYSVSLSSLFLSALLVPFSVLVLGIGDTIESLEKRVLAEKPVLHVNEIELYPKKFEAYFNDSFGLRTLFVSWGSALKSKYFKSSIAPENAVFGDDNWFFLSGSFDGILDDFSRRNLYTEEQLRSKINEWEERHTALEAKNIHYYKTFWPNKHSIYPEYLPFFIRIQQKDTLSRPDQVIKGLQESNSAVRFLDVRKALVSKKNNAQLYFKFDTHWNEYGAFVAYQELFNFLSKDFPELKPKGIQAFNIEWDTVQSGDLTPMLGIYDTEGYEDRRPTFSAVQKDDIEELSANGDSNVKVFVNSTSSNNLTVLVFRDSYTTALVNFITPHFKKSVFVWTSYDQRLVDEVQPDIVIEGYVERLFR